MKQIFNKVIKSLLLLFGNASRATKILGLFLFGLTVLSCFEISEVIPGYMLSLLALLVIFSAQITRDLQRWFSECSIKFFSKKNLFIFLGLLIADIGILTYCFSSSGEIVYYTDFFYTVLDIILSLVFVLVMVALIPLVYLTIRTAIGPLKPSQKAVRVSTRKFILISIYSILAFVGFWIVVILIGWGLYTSQEFISSIYWDKYFCGPSKIEKATSGVVRIETESGTGSGFWIDDDLVLTNNHVVLFDSDINIVAVDATYYSADVVQTDTIKDLAILRIAKTTDYEKPKVIQWRKRWPVLAEDVFVLGYPEGTKDITATRSIVSSLTSDEFDSTPYIQTDASINEGNSGGPLVDICGRVMGISSSTLLDAENIGFAVNGSRIKDQLEEMIIASRKITSEEVKQGQTGGETEAVIKYYFILSQGDFEDAYDYYSNDLKSQVLFKGWKESYKNTFAVRFKSAKRTSVGMVEVSFKTVDFPNDENDDYTVKEFRGTWSLIKEGGLWKLNYSNIREVPLEQDPY